MSLKMTLFCLYVVVYVLTLCSITTAEVKEVTSYLRRANEETPPVVKGVGNHSLHHNGSHHAHHNRKHHSHLLHHGNKTKEWDCNREWPSLDIYMCLESFGDKRNIRFYEVEINFLRSYLYFWPLKISKTNLVMTYDEETENGVFIQTLKQTMKELSPKLYDRWKMVSTPPSTYYRKGYDRMQINMFYADNFTTADYVGYVDTDTVFSTYVDREDLFEDGKPVFNTKGGLTQENSFPSPFIWMEASYRILGLTVPFTCMSHFPVLIKRTHLRELRDYVANRHNMSFSEAFYHVISKDGAGKYCQFDIMCTYVWNFHRDDYKWYVRMMENFTIDALPHPGVGQDPDLKQITPEMRFPKPFISTHSRYRNVPIIHPNNLYQITGNRFVEFNYFMQQGTCYSPPFPRNESVCAKRDPQKYYREMHNFDFVDFTKVYSHEQLNEASRIRYERIKDCNPSWDEKELKAVMGTQASWLDEN